MGATRAGYRWWAVGRSLTEVHVQAVGRSRYYRELHACRDEGKGHRTWKKQVLGDRIVTGWRARWAKTVYTGPHSQESCTGIPQSRPFRGHPITQKRSYLAE